MSKLLSKYNKEPNSCPFCDSDNIDIDHMDEENERQITCLDCGRTYKLIFKVVAIEEI